MKNNIRNIVNLIGILVIVIFSFMFTYLSLETVNVDGKVYNYCRKVEFWCYKPYNAFSVYYLIDEEKYRVEWTLGVSNVDIKGGKFKKEGFEYKTNASDGQYDQISGYKYYDPESGQIWLIVPDDEHKLIGTVV